MKSKLGVLNRLYDVHVAGEGGEYETLTLDSPVFKKRLVINGCSTVFHSDDAFAPVAYLDIKKNGRTYMHGISICIPDFKPNLRGLIAWLCILIAQVGNLV